jgi:hypothetical protein
MVMRLVIPTNIARLVKAISISHFALRIANVSSPSEWIPAFVYAYLSVSIVRKGSQLISTLQHSLPRLPPSSWVSHLLTRPSDSLSLMHVLRYVLVISAQSAVDSTTTSTAGHLLRFGSFLQPANNTPPGTPPRGSPLRFPLHSLPTYCSSDALFISQIITR